MLVDSHAHITNEYYENIDQVVKNAKKNNVLKIINCSTSFNDIDEIIKISKEHNLYYALGIHPEEADKVNEILKQKLEGYIVKNIEDKSFIALGEIGLDYYYTKENKDAQLELFDFQLSLAEKYNKPVIIHSREATQDTIDSISRYNVKGCVHSFSGSYETAMIYINRGYVLGINGVITFKNSNLKDVISKVGLENIIIETDSPYLSPDPLRGTKNTPANVKIIVEFLANLFRISPEKVVKITTENLFRIFDIK